MRPAGAPFGGAATVSRPCHRQIPYPKQLTSGKGRWRLEIQSRQRVAFRPGLIATLLPVKIAFRIAAATAPRLCRPRDSSSSPALPSGCRPYLECSSVVGPMALTRKNASPMPAPSNRSRSWRMSSGSRTPHPPTCPQTQVTTGYYSSTAQPSAGPSRSSRRFAAATAATVFPAASTGDQLPHTSLQNARRALPAPCLPSPRIGRSEWFSGSGFPRKLR